MDQRQINMFDYMALEAINDKNHDMGTRVENYKAQALEGKKFEANAAKKARADKMNAAKEKFIPRRTPSDKVHGQMNMRFNKEGVVDGYYGGVKNYNLSGEFDGITLNKKRITDMVDMDMSIGDLAKSISNYKLPIAIGGAVLGGMALQSMRDNRRDRRKND